MSSLLKNRAMFPFPPMEDEIVTTEADLLGQDAVTDPLGQGGASRELRGSGFLC